MPGMKGVCCGETAMQLGERLQVMKVETVSTTVSSKTCGEEAIVYRHLAGDQTGPKDHFLTFLDRTIAVHKQPGCPILPVTWLSFSLEPPQKCLKAGKCNVQDGQVDDRER